MKKIMFRHIFYVMALGVVLSFASCVKDKGNYTYSFSDGVVFPYDENSEYSKINSVAGLELSFSPFLGIYDPNVGEVVLNMNNKGEIIPGMDNNETKDFIYQWWDISDASKPVLLDPLPVTNPETGQTMLAFSDESTLNWTVPLGKRAGSYTLKLMAQSIRTGVVYSHRFSLQVNSYTQNGFLLLTQNGPDVNIDMVSFFENEFLLFKDVLSTPAEERRYPYENKTAIDLITYRDPFAFAGAYNKYSMWILTEESCDRLGTSDFSYQPSQNISPTIPGSTQYLKGINVTPEKMIMQSSTVENNASEAFYFEGNWYWQAQNQMNTFLWENPVNIPHIYPAGTPDPYMNPKGNEIPVTKHAALARSAGGGGALLMWTEDGRFLYKTGSGAGMGSARGSMVSVWVTDPSSEVDPPFSFSTKYRMINMGERNDMNSIYAIVYDPDMEKYRFLGLTGVASTVNKALAYNFPSDKVSDEYTKFWCVNPGVYMYIATKDDKVYSIYLDANSREKDITSIVNPNGHEIVLFEKLSSEGHAQANVLGNEWFYVVTKDPTLPEDECCTLAVYRRVDGDTEGNVELAEYKYTNLLGETTNTPLKWEGIGNAVALTWKDK